MRNLPTITALFGLLTATGLQARPAPNSEVPPSVQKLLDCRSISDSTQRLACYDHQAATLGQAITTRDVVVIDKARATAAKKSLFGFSIPNFGGLFGGNDNDVNQIESTIVAVGHNADGGWTVRLADGSTWTQVDDAQLGLPPERGEKVVVKRGSLGSFYIDFPKQPGFKAKRIG